MDDVRKIFALLKELGKKLNMELDWCRHCAGGGEKYDSSGPYDCRDCGGTGLKWSKK